MSPKNSIQSDMTASKFDKTVASDLTYLLMWSETVKRTVLEQIVKTRLTKMSNSKENSNRKVPNQMVKPKVQTH